MEEPVRFHASGQNLFGILNLPEGMGSAESTTAALVMVVGGPQTRVGSHRSYTLIARELSRRGMPVLRFDYAGIGDSDGTFMGFAHAGPSLDGALQWLHGRLPKLSKVVLWSLCDGSSACAINAASVSRPLAGLILCNPYVHSQQGRAKVFLKYYYLKRAMDPAFWMKLISFKFNPFKAASSLASLAKSAALGKPDAKAASATATPIAGNPSGTASPEARGGAASNSGSAPVGLVGPGEDPPGLPEKVMEGLERYRGPLFLILSEDDFTAKEFLGLYKDRGTLAKRRPGQTGVRFVAGADHTFTAAEWKGKVCDLTFEAWDAILGGKEIKPW
ncbi:MAG: hydrolase 1, exosortase A system-associated [Fibrobacterota bacterium]|nr:hydrolase 1, exosortase A system-associated [Fibrobacterota bacterium]